jgi:hypothetical protein
MTHTVTLKKADKVILLEALSASQEIKEQKLKKSDSINLMNKNYLDAAHKFCLPIEIHDRKKNIMTWFIDQMKHSGKLWDTELCVRACEIANRVIDNTYDHYKSIEHFEDLFRFEE